MPGFGQAERIKLHIYPGGHVRRAWLDSAQAFRRDAMAIYGDRLTIAGCQA